MVCDLHYVNREFFSYLKWSSGMLVASEELEQRIYVNAYDPYEVRYWKRRLGVTEADLANAVAKVGKRAERVIEFLRS
jgi:hypothetical protein